ncbi:Pectinesterase inhibitor [Gossypium australe]|uniref:Pectinesterase inhibitor n=1 Tax=Gossypium australe TaxID=47621 RepID=A0A5B6UDS5_9ROSI|nr:Pectinesterase inhibitor [Gossypium australe]
MMMNSYTCFLAFFSILLVSVSCNNIIQEACIKAVKSDSQPKVTFNFCVGSLEKHPKGEMARSYEDLAPITLHIMKSAAKHVSFIISKMKTKNFALNFTRLRSGLVTSSVTCEDVFNEGKKTVSPISKENNDFCRLAIMLLTFIPDAKSE